MRYDLRVQLGVTALASTVLASNSKTVEVYNILRGGAQIRWYARCYRFCLVIDTVGVSADINARGVVEGYVCDYKHPTWSLSTPESEVTIARASVRIEYSLV
jgi:hypothetical protein